MNKLAKDRFAATTCPGVTAAARNELAFIFGTRNGRPWATLAAHRLASLSKPITGTIIMDLASQGKLELDAPVKRYLPELSESYLEVTLRYFLNHQPGVHDVLQTFMGLPLMFTFGTTIEYAPLSLTVAWGAAESVTGHSFQQLSSFGMGSGKLPWTIR